MKDKTKEQLVEEIESLRREVAELAQEKTERKKTEEVLQQSEQNFRNSLDSSPLGIRIVTAEGELLYANQTILDIYGYSSVEALKAVPAKQRYTPESYAGHQERKEKRKLGQPVPSDYEVSIVRKDGEVRHLSVSRREVAWGGKTQFQSLYQDITERKQAEQELRESEEKYRLLAENMTDVLFAHDMTGNLSYVSPSAGRLFGYTTEEMFSLRMKDCIHPDSMEEVANHFRKYTTLAREKKDTGEPLLEYKCVRKDGSTFWGESKTKFLCDSNGNPIGAQVLLRDITERKQAEEELRTSKAFLDATGRIAKIGGWERDVATQDGKWTEEIFRLFELPVEDRPPPLNEQLKFFHPDDVPKLTQFMQLASEHGKPYDIELRVITAKGHRIWTQAICTPIIEDGKTVKLAGTFQDITERRQAEEAVRESERKYRILFDSRVDGTVVVDAETAKIVLANQAAADMTGLDSVEELVGTDPFEFIPPEDRERVIKIMAEDMFEKDLRQPNEYRVVTKDGKEIWISAVGAQIEHEGKLAGLASFRDVTQQKKAEQALESSRAFLENLTNSMWDVVFSVKMPERIIDWANDSFNHIGYKPEECIGRTTEFLYPAEEGFRTFGKKLERTIAAGKDVLHTEQLLKRRNGEVFPAEITVTFFKEKGEVVRVTSIVHDITERKRTQKTLEESEELYRGLFENSPEAVFTSDIDGNLTSCNTALEELTGYAWEELSKMKPVANIAPESSEFVLKRYQKVLSTGEPIRDISFELIRKDGKKRLVEGYLTPIKKEDRIAGFQGALRDITARRQAEEALEQSEAHLKEAQRLAKIGSWRWVAETDTHTWSEEYRNIFGWGLKLPPPSHAGMHRLFSTESWARLEYFTRQAFEKGTPYEVELEIVRLDGTTGNIVSRGEPIWDNSSHIVGLHGTVLDITERKRAEEQMLRLSKAVGISADSIIITDMEGKIIDVNEATVEMYGGDAKGDLLGKNGFDFVAPAELENRDGRRKELLIEGYARGVAYRVITINGREIPVEVNSSVMRDADGNPAGFVAIIRDITERKRAEEELEISRQQLRNLAAHAESAREGERTRIAREMHDEMGQALTALKMDLAWLNKALPQDQIPLLEKTQTMTKLNDTAIQMVKRIATELRPGILDDLGLSVAIEWQVGEFQKRTGIESEVCLDPEDIALDEVLSTAIFRIFQETLTNVARHAQATKVKISLEEKDAKLVLEVADNGRGITKKQLSDPKSLGLVGMRERVLPWQGEVKISGTRGEGTTVTVNVPLGAKGEIP